tara:strand:- start:176 stop:445 length:270 start_codon:yes stop_codon:yes gene_type:complete
MDNGNSDWIFTKPEELDSSIYADALKMTEEKYASGTQIYFIYVDEEGKRHNGEITLKGDCSYDISNMFDNDDLGTEVEYKVMELFTAVS